MNTHAVTVTIGQQIYTVDAAMQAKVEAWGKIQILSKKVPQGHQVLGAFQRTDENPNSSNLYRICVPEAHPANAMVASAIAYEAIVETASTSNEQKDS